MKELVEVITKALVDDPDSVVVTEREEKRTTILEIKVADSDMGKVIGKQGRIAKAIRQVVKAAAAKEDKKSHRRHYGLAKWERPLCTGQTPEYGSALFVPAAGRMPGCPGVPDAFATGRELLRFFGDQKRNRWRETWKSYYR